MSASTHGSALLAQAQCSAVRFSRSTAFTSILSCSSLCSSGTDAALSATPPQCCIARWSGLRFSSSTCVTDAPASSSSMAQPICPLLMAYHSGVRKEPSVALASAPLRSASVSASAQPCWLSQWSGVLSVLSVAAREAPASIRRVAEPAAPSSQARSRGVRSWPSSALRSALWAIRTFTHSPASSSQARCSGVWSPCAAQGEEPRRVGLLCECVGSELVSVWAQSL